MRFTAKVAKVRDFCGKEPFDRLHLLRRTTLRSPFLQVRVVFFHPGRCAKCPTALVGKTDGPCTETQSFCSCAPAKIHIVEMKIEPRIKQHLVVDERGFPGGQKDSVQKLAVGRSAAENTNHAERMPTMGDAATQIIPAVPCKLVVDKRPSRLVLNAPAIAGHTDH